MLSKSMIAKKICSKMSRNQAFLSTNAAKIVASAAPVKVTQTKLVIDGKLVDAASGRKFETLDPRTGKVIASIAEADAIGMNPML